MAVCSEDGFCRFISTMADGKIMNNVVDIAKLFTECIRLHCVMALIPTETQMKTKKNTFSSTHLTHTEIGSIWMEAHVLPIFTVCMRLKA